MPLDRSSESNGFRCENAPAPPVLSSNETGGVAHPIKQSDEEAMISQPLSTGAYSNKILLRGHCCYQLCNSFAEQKLRSGLNKGGQSI